MKQRPTQIVAILKTIDADSSASLEAYITDLEARQQTPRQDVSTTDPIWSHQRTAKRAQRRQERAARERNNYQSIAPLRPATVESK